MQNETEKLESNKKIAKKSGEFFQTLNVEELRKIAHPNYKLHLPGLPGPVDFDGSVDFNKQFADAFSDRKVTVEFQLAEGNRVASRVVFEGTHTGEFQGIAPTRKKVSVTGIVIQEIVDGKIMEEWDEFDNFSLFQQLGQVPELESIK